MKTIRRIFVLAVQLTSLVWISYELTKFLLSLKWEKSFGLSPYDSFSNSALLYDGYSNLSVKTDQTYYISSQMRKHENKITLGFTEKDLEELYEVRSVSTRKKIILNYGNLTINIIRDFSICYACDCELIFDKSRWLEADVIILTDHLYPVGPRPPNQLWFIFVHEPPPIIKIADGLENK
ncbi:unnamed protein product, partial [Schistosoma turkestanicum]